jgi:hypothetical protein
MFRLITTVKRSAFRLPPTWRRYPSPDEARAAAALLLEDRVQPVMIGRDESPGGFVEGRER